MGILLILVDLVMGMKCGIRSMCLIIQIFWMKRMTFSHKAHSKEMFSCVN